MPSFKKAGDLLCLTAQEMADALGSTVQSIRQARLDEDKDGYRPPPDGWESRLAALARKRAAELVALAEELEG